MAQFLPLDTGRAINAKESTFIPYSSNIKYSPCSFFIPTLPYPRGRPAGRILFHRADFQKNPFQTPTESTSQSVSNPTHAGHYQQASSTSYSKTEQSQPAMSLSAQTDSNPRSARPSCPRRLKQKNPDSTNMHTLRNILIRLTQSGAERSLIEVGTSLMIIRFWCSRLRFLFYFGFVDVVFSTLGNIV